MRVPVAEGLLRLLRIRLRKLREARGKEDEATMDCILELGRQLQGQQMQKEAEEMYKECLELREGLSVQPL